MKIFNLLLFICLLFTSCKEKASSSIKIRPLSIEQIKKAISMADSITIIGEPSISHMLIWDTTLSKAVTMHETIMQVELQVSLDENGNPVNDSTRVIAMKIQDGPIITSISCSFSCQRDSPDATCSDASGCIFDRNLRECTVPDCGSGCSLLRGCKLDIKSGFSAQVMQ